MKGNPPESFGGNRAPFYLLSCIYSGGLLPEKLAQRGSPSAWCWKLIPPLCRFLPMNSDSKSPTDTYPMRTLRTGDVITPTSGDNPVTILACWLMRPSDVDSYAWWLVLAHLPHNPFHPFAVWNAYDHPERGWSFANGDYCVTVTEATARYEARGGQYELV